MEQQVDDRKKMGVSARVRVVEVLLSVPLSALIVSVGAAPTPPNRPLTACLTAYPGLSLPASENE